MLPTQTQNEIHPTSLENVSNTSNPKIAVRDSKIQFVTQFCQGKSVLDIGCVQHDPKNYQSPYWLHKAIQQVADSVIGIDIDAAGVQYLVDRGFNIVVADAQHFDLQQKFDVLVAGDIIEHLEDLQGFLSSCRHHMHPESKLLISTPNPWFWKHTVRAAFKTEFWTNPEHTCWFCPRTLRQLVRRHGFDIGDIVFGSRYFKERIMPLPPAWKHTSFHAEVSIAP